MGHLSVIGLWLLACADLPGDSPDDDAFVGAWEVVVHTSEHPWFGSHDLYDPAMPEQLEFLHQGDLLHHGWSYGPTAGTYNGNYGHTALTSLWRWTDTAPVQARIWEKDEPTNGFAGQCSIVDQVLTCTTETWDGRDEYYEAERLP